MKILGAAGLYILYRELTKGVSPITVVPSTPTNGLGLDDTESEAERIAKQKEKDEAAKKETEEKVKAEEDEKKKFEDLQFLADQAFIANNPHVYVDCKFGFQPVLKGQGTRDSVYYWVCEKLPKMGL
jgi:hypothetical protein